MIYFILNISKKWTKKIIVLILIFIAGAIGGVFFLQIASNSQKDNGQDSSYNSAKNSENKSINTDNTDTAKEENKTSANASNTTNNSSTATSENKSNTSTTKKESENGKQNAANQTDLSTYKAVWQFPDSTYPEQELAVKSITNSKVDFSYTIDGITTFENASATISGNVATFDIKNEGDWNIKGTITFDGNKVIFNIKESSSENIPTGSTTFNVKSSKSAF